MFTALVTVANNKRSMIKTKINTLKIYNVHCLGYGSNLEHRSIMLSIRSF